MFVSLAENHICRRPWFLLAVLLSSMLVVPGCWGADSEQMPGDEVTEETDDVVKVPTWVHANPESDDLFDRFAIHSGFWSTSEETSSEYTVILNRRLRSHIDGSLNLVTGRTDAHQFVLYELDQFKKLVHITEPYLETRDFEIGPMYQLHSLVEVATTLDQEMACRWRHYEGRHRVRQLALGWLTILGSIAIVFVHLHLPGQGIIARKRTWVSLGLVITLLVFILLLARWVQWI